MMTDDTATAEAARVMARAQARAKKRRSSAEIEDKRQEKAAKRAEREAERLRKEEEADRLSRKRIRIDVGSAGVRRIRVDPAASSAPRKQDAAPVDDRESRRRHFYDLMDYANGAETDGARRVKHILGRVAEVRKNASDALPTDASAKHRRKLAKRQAWRPPWLKDAPPASAAHIEPPAQPSPSDVGFDDIVPPDQAARMIAGLQERRHRPQALRWTADLVAARMVAAADTFARQPSKVRPQGYRSSMPEYLIEWEDEVARAGAEADVREAHAEEVLRDRALPTAYEIELAEEAMCWPGRYLGQHAALLHIEPGLIRTVTTWAHWSAIHAPIDERLRRRRWDASRFWRLQDLGVRLIAAGLAKDGVQVR